MRKKRPKAKPPASPSPAASTTRQELEARLREGGWLFDVLAHELGLTDRTLEDELKHVDRSLRARGERLVVEPARCRSCDYVFRERTHLRPPSRCPECKEEWIEAPRLSIA